jgi:immune inhibitor A
VKPIYCAVIALLISIFTCLCVLSIGLLFIFYKEQSQITPTSTSWGIENTPTLVVEKRPTQENKGLVIATPIPNDQITRQPTPTLAVFMASPSPTPEQNGETGDISSNTLDTLENTIITVNDLNDLAKRFYGIQEIPATLPAPDQPYQVGDEKTFWVSNSDTNESFQVAARLQYVTDHAYFWIEEGVNFNQNHLRNLVETFEAEIYPTNREFFGSEWTPGVDSDPHLYMLYAGNLGSSIAGYFSSADEYSPLAHEYSNAHEMIFLNSDGIRLNRHFTYGTLAHEFQHMIHWYRDRNESSWITEGFSELAALLNGYYDSGFDVLFAEEPDMQLTDWPNDSDATFPHYGSSFLFLSYFLDRFREEATQSLVAEQNNDMASVDTVLKDIGVVDSLTGQPIRADDVFIDWVITNYLGDPKVGDGRYDYYGYPDAPKVEATEKFRRCLNGIENRDVHQYGADYIRFTCSGNFSLHFDGADQVELLPADAFSGSYAFWSNKSDEADMSLSQTFDFSRVTGNLTLNYWTWYDLEKDYDYLYVAVSENGQDWKILKTPSGTDADPSGNSYGWGYNNLSGGGDEAIWINEEVDLSDYAGKQVQLRFEYVTDTAVVAEGFLLDDVTIPEIGYFTDFEEDAGGWEAAGWARIENVLPQSFRLALITKGETTNVQYIPVSVGNIADIPLQLGKDVDEAILVVSGTTRYTRQLADYQFEVKP